MGWGLGRNGEVVVASSPRTLVQPGLEHTSPSEISDDWLEKFNKAAADREMPYHQRPFDALLLPGPRSANAALSSVRIFSGR